MAIPADEKHVFAVSRYMPPPGDPKPEHAVLRVWPITGEIRVGEVPPPKESALPPVDSVMFLPDLQLFLLATGHVIKVYNLK